MLGVNSMLSKHGADVCTLMLLTWWSQCMQVSPKIERKSIGKGGPGPRDDGW